MEAQDQKLRRRALASPALGGAPSGSAVTIAVDLTPVRPGGDNGGAKVFALELVERLAALNKDARFILLTHRATHEELAVLESSNVLRRVFSEDGAPVTAHATRAKSGLRRLAARLPARLRVRLARIVLSAWHVVRRTRARGDTLRDLGVDLLFCPFTDPRYAESGMPTVCVVHDLQYKTYPEFFEPEDLAHRDEVFRRAVSRATRLVAISEYTRQCVLRHGALAPSRVTTIVHRTALRRGFDRPIERGALDRHGLVAGRFLLYPANFWRHKNHEMLLVAFGLAVRRGLPDDVVLVLTGAPCERQRFLAMTAREMGIGDRVRFPGYVSVTDFSTVLRTALGIVFPSLYEGFGLPVIEAMAAGIPVACSRVTALPEVTADAAILFDPRVPTQICAAILQLSCDEASRERLIVDGRARASRFADGDEMAREYWHVFEEAMAGLAPRRPGVTG